MIIESVAYYELEDSDLPGYYGDYSPVAHDVEEGVEFGLAGGAELSMTWLNPTDTDGMGLAGHLLVIDRSLRDVSPGFLPERRSRHDVTAWPEWRPYVGQRIVELEHIQDAEVADLTYLRVAVRMHFEELPPVTVALGGTDPSGKATYELDKLVVFHNDAAAQTFLERTNRGELTVDADVMLAAMRQ